ncbi:MAG: alpha-L-fucosidase [Pyrinomonadaceae bacterium]|nr:alpha-L-fucosidase [Sphingobacteriaceae bacterium]
MNLKSLYLTLAGLSFASLCFAQLKPQFDIHSPASIKGTKVYESSIESIRKSYKFPKWFQDDKFGIFIHWGVYSVPAFGTEWYPRQMYIQNSREFRHHKETWGDHSKFGYKDFIPMFKAEKFNADEWVDLFQKAGAKFVVPVAEHHDGFAMYDSKVNPWNSVKMGPKKDIVALVREATLKRGLTFGLSTHRGENYYFFNGGMKYPSDVQDTTLSIYGTRSPDGPNRAPDAKFMTEWSTHLYELINWYQPSMIFFDGTPGDKFFKPAFTQFMAHYYNSAIDWGKEVGVNYKIGFPSDIAIYDVERGKLRGIRRNPWQSDSSVGKKSWSYIEGEEYKTSEQMVKDMLDIVSKNGSFLLNIGPRADGSIPDGVKKTLLEIGEWLKMNGEAIYGTRPWVKFGEGAVQAAVGSRSDAAQIPFTAQDIRFTTKGSDLYAIPLAWTDGTITVISLSKTNTKNLKVKNVTMLGSKEKIVWKQTDEGLKITFPKVNPGKFAYPFKIQLEGLVVSNPEPYFVERDPNPPTTADTYVYNHGKTPASATVKLFATGKEMGTKKLTLKPGSALRIESSIIGITLPTITTIVAPAAKTPDMIEGLNKSEGLKADNNRLPFSAVIF